MCLPGEHTDGNQFVTDAVARGAVCVVSQQPPQIELSIPWVTVPDSLNTLAYLSDYFYGHPSQKLRLIGVTGTSGKTTTTHLIEHIFNRLGRKSGLIGTLGYRLPGKTDYEDLGLTTPQSSDVQKFLHQMRNVGCSYVSMEVSSHALMQSRVGACQFAVAVLTNITQDHLDFHKTMESYTQAKLALFTGLNHSQQLNKSAVINADDPAAKIFLNECGESIRKLTYGIGTSNSVNAKTNTNIANADIKALSIAYDFNGTQVELETPLGHMKIKTKLAGRFNVYNLMAAIGVAVAEGVSLEECANALKSFTGVPGRFEVVNFGNSAQPLCIVDYSHKPDALENVLRTARGLIPDRGRLLVVFGCGGDRDVTKRPKMGKIAEAEADLVIVTSDNPRSESPEQIIKDIVAGISNMDKVKVEPDRSAAIQLAINTATERDVVVVAGKGHETYQILADRTIPFDDRVQIREALSACY